MDFHFYVIKLRLSTQRDVFVVWGQSDTEDKFLIDHRQSIRSFTSLASLARFKECGHVGIFPFPANGFFSYDKLFSNELTFYSVNDAFETLARETGVEALGRSEYELLINIYNLISDYFFQIKDAEILAMRENASMKLFFDYYYARFFWKQGPGFSEVKDSLPSFDYPEFVRIYKKLVDIFETRIDTVE